MPIVSVPAVIVSRFSVAHASAVGAAVIDRALAGAWRRGRAGRGREAGPSGPARGNERGRRFRAWVGAGGPWGCSSSERRSVASGAADADSRSRARPSRRAALPLDSARARLPGRILVHQELAGRRLAEGAGPARDPRRAGVPLPELERQLGARLDGPERGGEVGDAAAEAKVAEGVDVGDPGAEAAGLDDGRRAGRAGRGSPDRPAAPPSSNGSPSARCAATGAKTSRPWNVALVLGSSHSRFSRTRASVTPPSRSAAGTRRPLSGPIRTSPRAVRRRDRPAIRADARIDDRDVDPDREPRHGRREEVGAVADRVLRDRVADVDDLRVARDREHDAAADGGGPVEPEVGQEADDRPRTIGSEVGRHGPRMVPNEG